MKKYLLALIPLLIICVIASALLGFFNEVTKGPIAENAIKAAEATRAAIFPEAKSFVPVELEEGSSLNECYEAVDNNGETIGYTGLVTVQGYKPGIEVTVGINNDNKIVNVQVGGSNFSETAGLGAKAKEPAFTNQFIGKSIPVKLSKNAPEGDTNVVDAISGATMTSNGILGGVNTVGQYVLSMTSKGEVNKASAQGFGGPVAVALTLADDQSISEIAIGDEFFNETEGFGARALTDENFRTQFIGKKPPIAFEEIDALSGATITSKAVVEAINKAYAQMTGAEVDTPAEATPILDENASESAELPKLSGAKIFASVAQGFGGPVIVEMNVSEEGIIEAIKISENNFAETPGLGAKALEDDFQLQFIGKRLPIALTDIDAIAGATITSKAVVEAVNNAYGNVF